VLTLAAPDVFQAEQLNTRIALTASRILCGLLGERGKRVEFVAEFQRGQRAK